MLDSLAEFGRKGIQAVERLGRGHLLFVQILAGITSLLPRLGLLVAQIHNIGVRTITIIVVSGLFVGMVLGLQGYYVLSQFGAEESLGVMVAASLVRELGPVVTALLFAGRAGSALTASSKRKNRCVQAMSVTICSLSAAADSKRRSARSRR